MLYLKLILLFTLFPVYLCKLDSPNTFQKSASDIPHDDHKEGILDKRKIYIELFKQKRVEQKLALKRLISMELPKRIKLLEASLPAIQKVFAESRREIDTVTPTITNNNWFESEKLKEKISQVFENLALFSDFVAHFPTICKGILLKEPMIKVESEWALKFTKSMNVLDEETLQIVDVMAQELDFVAKATDFRNPFDETIKQNGNLTKTLFCTKI
ncbi:unnamed protein product, partial [Mesorhabditis belari]|uniref:Uncharacterized protein n=1 Tax=Mesorhabditis belari TaxID=2138241 RepID=A0AAF3FEE4_9BILA